MRLSGFRRRVRFAVRDAIVGTAPQLYWRFRRWRRGDEEPELAVLPLLCSRSRLAIDVGANYGMYVARLVGLSQRCVVFEPIPRLAAMLRRGFGPTVDVRETALSDHRGHAVLRVPDLNTGYATMSSANALSAMRAVRVRELRVATSRLDDEALSDVGFIKIDVEGHEEAVLRGSVDLLRRDRPNLLVEVEDRHNPGAVLRIVDWMRALDYAALVIACDEVHCLPDFDLSKHQATTPASEYIRNVIFTPTETAVALRDAITGQLASLSR